MAAVRLLRARTQSFFLIDGFDRAAIQPVSHGHDKCFKYFWSLVPWKESMINKRECRVRVELNEVALTSNFVA